MKKLVLTPFALSLLTFACSGGEGEAGADGINGSDGADGRATVFSSTDLEPGEECADGGILVSFGLDQNADGVLDEDEVAGSNALCNGGSGADGSNGAQGEDGADGTNGSNGLNGSDGVNGSDGNDGASLSALAVAAGDDCENGGWQIFEDTNPVGFVCAGLDGADGSDGASGAKGDQGDKGEQGDKGDAGTNGSDGSSVTVQAVGSSAECPAGGFAVYQDSVLQGHICNGEDGVAGSDTDAFVDIADADCSDATRGTQETPNCSINAAIYYSGYGATVYVAAGTYEESVVVDRPLQLRGGYDSSDWTQNLNADPAIQTTNIVGKETGYGVYLDSRAVVLLEGFSISARPGGGAGVYTKGVVEIRHNSITGGDAAGINTTTTGLTIASGGDAFVHGNYIYGGENAYVGNPTGFAVVDAQGAILVNNLIEGGERDGSAGGSVYANCSSTLFYVNNTMLAGSSNAENTFNVYTRCSANTHHFINNQFMQGTSTSGETFHFVGGNEDYRLTNNNVEPGDIASYWDGSTQITASTDFIDGTCVDWPDARGCDTGNSGNFSSDPNLAADFTPGAGTDNINGGLPASTVEGLCDAVHSASRCDELVSEMAFDYYGGARTGNPDIGAVER